MQVRTYTWFLADSISTQHNCAAMVFQVSLSNTQISLFSISPLCIFFAKCVCLPPVPPHCQWSPDPPLDPCSAVCCHPRFSGWLKCSNNWNWNTSNLEVSKFHYYAEGKSDKFIFIAFLTLYSHIWDSGIHPPWGSPAKESFKNALCGFYCIVLNSWYKGILST